MRLTYLSNYINKALAAALLVGAAVSLPSCNAFHEDLDPCPQGIRLRFVYDYILDDGNVIFKQVDCLTLLVYDKEGNYIETRTAGPTEIENEDWRMDLDLPAGDYHMLAYGGMDCEKSTFRFATPVNETKMEDVEVYLPSNLITSPVGTDLHPLYYGALDVTVPETGMDYTPATLYLMKDTNDIRILLGNESGLPTNVDDFVFTITDNNTRFNYLNQVISTENVTYHPWIWGDSEVGILPDQEPAVLSWAELSVPRLMANSKAVLKVNRVDDGREVLSIPLVNILLMLKSEHFNYLKPQEFLDRQSRWNLTFFLTNDGVWAGVSIVINDWIVRINNVSEF